MAEGGSQRDARRNKVFKAMNRPLTVLGAERRLFFVALITGGSVFSMLHSLLGGIGLFIVGVIIARIATKHPAASQATMPLAAAQHIASRTAQILLGPSSARSAPPHTGRTPPSSPRE